MFNIYCSNCGKEINDNVNYCAFCGAKIDTSSDKQAKNIPITFYIKKLFIV